MSFGLLSKLKSAFSFGVQRAFRVKQNRTRNLIVDTTLGLKRIGNCRSKRSAIEASFQRHSSAISVSSFSQGSGFGNWNMAASSSPKATSGDLLIDSFISSCGNVSSFGKSSGVYFSNRSPSVCRKASLSLRKGGSRNCSMVCGYFLLDIRRKFCDSNPLVGSWFQSYSTLSSTNYSDGAVPDVSHDGSSCSEHLGSHAISDDQKTSGDGTLKLLSGSCYLPHPAKEATGGEDAYFICAEEQAVGVADGVGGWADVGINAGEYSRELMSNSMNALRDEPKELIDPARVLEKAYSRTNALGSSTACILVLKNQGLHAINLGDSGFIVVRDGCTIFESPVQQHGFNIPYQLERGNNCDLPSSGQVFSIPVSHGDVIVAGTDGLFDNLYNHEITATVANALTASLSAEETAQKIAALARERAQDRIRQTPFSTAAQQSGYTYNGGKLDDITVVVSYVTSSTDT